MNCICMLRKERIFHRKTTAILSITQNERRKYEKSMKYEKNVKKKMKSPKGISVFYVKTGERVDVYMLKIIL